MAGLSVCMIVKNEERVIARALESVRSVADEIIVADTGSTDATKRICERYTDKIYDFEWKDDFSAARNFSFAQATRPYIMWLDADDTLSEQSVKALSDMMRSLDSEPHDAVMCRYVTARDESGRPTFSYYRERIVRKAAEPVWTGFVHECMRPFADAVYSDDIVIDHYRPGGRDPRRNLNIYQKKIAEGVRLDGRGKYYYGRELYYNKLYLEAACVLEDYLAGTDKWYVNAPWRPAPCSPTANSPWATPTGAWRRSAAVSAMPRPVRKRCASWAGCSANATTNRPRSGTSPRCPARRVRRGSPNPTAWTSFRI